MDLTDKQQYELLAAISARGEIPVKFAYLDDGAQKWDEIYHQWEERDLVTEQEMNLLLYHIDGILNSFAGSRGINLIDLGCGNGLPAIYLLQKLRERDIQANYLGVDISPAMITLALDNINNALPGIKTKSLLIDFEKESLADHLLAIKQHNKLPNLLINLGNTLGNYINASGTLTNFLEAMTLEDYLLLGNGLTNDLNTQKIIDTYNVPLIIDIVTGPARKLGIYTSKDSFRYIWNASLNRIEGRVKLESKKLVTLARQAIKLEIGDEILVHRSHKYTEASLMKVLSDVGFRTELMSTTKNRSHIIAMVQPTRYSAS